jgi:hypothetical protein
MGLQLLCSLSGNGQHAKAYCSSKVHHLNDLTVLGGLIGLDDDQLIGGLSMKAFEA